MLADQKRLESGATEELDIGRGMDAAFGDLHDARRYSLREPQRGVERNLECLQVAIVDSDEVGSSFERDIKFSFVVRLDQRSHPVAGRCIAKRADALDVEDRD